MMALATSILLSLALALTSLTSPAQAAPQRGALTSGIMAGRVFQWGMDPTVQRGIAEAINGGPIDSSKLVPKRPGT
ncbi:hypothetical protein GQ602_003427 [Ophiocordyceps camponoti-floridani]|uniref:Uncharacterized protein n=1 Tax=Ophiocordyceps camponoti-floridani TaxID=2030778 RepID=A0A8H4Q872_9HYPO|nr:hypothetical protein GQ602_003427 [Ophiocordyceps camponoti-floridani]